MEKMTMEKFEALNKNAESVKMTQAIFGQSKEKPGTASAKDLVFATEVEREAYLYNLSLSEDTMNALKIPREQFEAAKSAIRSEMKDALAILQETAVGGTALNYKKREAALKTIDDLWRAERMRQQAETLESLKKGPRSEKVAPTRLSPDQENTQARLQELEELNAVRKANMEEVQALSLDALVERNDKTVADAVKKLEYLSGNEKDPAVQKNIRNLIGSYRDALNMQNMLRGTSQGKTLENERTFANSLFNLRLQKVDVK